MTLIDILRAEAADEQRTILVAANLTGVAQALILASINAVALAPEAGDARALFLFTLLAALYVLCARYTNSRMAVLIEAALHRIKVRVGEKIARAEFDALERVKAAEICDRITENTSFISDRGTMIAGLLQSSVITLCTMMYIAWISVPALALVLLLCGVGAAMFVSVRKEYVVHAKQATMNRITLLERLDDLLGGFKEVKLSRRREREIRGDIVQTSDSLRAVNASANNLSADNILLGQGLLFALLSAVVFTPQVTITADAAMVVPLVAAVMFLWGPFMTITQGLLPYSRANAALAEIEALEAKLDVAARSAVAGEAVEDPWQGRMTRLEVRDVEYAYTADNGGEPFTIGPLSLDIEAGSVVFIVGGNGSGKSTFLKVLTGLYRPSAGALCVDGVTVRPENVASYRDMISAIFSDFHLFGKLYGLAGIEEDAVHRLLVRMRLEARTSVAHRRFTKLTLSTGQKKRLAMVVALLEARPICVFDEWAADQDPEFRSYFYEELLPQLRREGKAVIVVSHDDRYFHCADRVVTMEYGKIRSIESIEPRGPIAVQP